MSVCRGARDLTFQYPCSCRFPLQAGGTERVRHARFPLRSRENQPLARFPLRSRGNQPHARFPLRSVGNLKEGGNA
jgi:hypothetical protein